MSGPLTAGERLAPENSGPEGPDRRRRRDETPKQRKRKRSTIAGRVVSGLFGLGAVVALAGGTVAYVAYERYASDLPDVAGLRSYQPPVMSRVYADNEQLIAELATERRLFVPFAAIPDLVKKAFVSAEDQNFWTHRGVDPLAIARAAVGDLANYGQGRRPAGASTITQQVAKNMLLDNQLSLARKIREAILAVRIENTLSKDRILELYLNEIYLGLGSYGVAAAAQAYFNKPLDELTIPEAAFLAALPKAPNNYNPFRFADAARARRDWVLDRMADTGAITLAQATAAKATPVIPAAFRRPETVPGADWFAEEVRRHLIDKFGADTTTQGGLIVRTSLDPALQAAADRALHDGLVAYDRKMGGWRGPVGHIDGGASVRNGWPERLGAAARPPGMLSSWRFGLVLETTGDSAQVGWLEPGGTTGSQSRTGTLLLRDLGWARPVRDGKSGAAPRRMTDVVSVGDLVMIEPAATAEPTPPPKPGAKGKVEQVAAVRPDRVVLRQIPVVQGALVSLDPTTGRVLAMVGGWSFSSSQFNRATQANRQPGSSFKPMVYLTALEQGVSPSQRFMDAPIVVDMGAAGQWRPNNYEMDFGGPTPLRIALEKSLNLVTIRVAQRVGMDAVAQTATAFHVVDQMPKVLPAALGAVDTTVLRQAGAYASLDEGGREVLPTLIDSVQDRDGHVVWRAPGRLCDGCSAAADAPPTLTDERKQIADPDSVFQLVTMMQGVVQRGTGFPAGRGLNRPIAGKTGTSQDFNDAWFVGFTPDLVTAVWVGFDQPSSLGDNETGGAVAAPIWHDYMAVALKGRPVLNFVPPPGVTLAQWDSGSGMVTDAFKDGQVPGASGPIAGGGEAVVDGGAGQPGAAPGHATAGGVDSALGGLY